METYTRDYLKTLPIHARGYEIEKRIVREVIQTASRNQTRYLVNSSLFYEYHKKEQITEWLVSRLKETFPGVTVKYREATDLRGNVERGIVIDWS